MAVPLSLSEVIGWKDDESQYEKEVEQSTTSVEEAAQMDCQPNNEVVTLR